MKAALITLLLLAGSLLTAGTLNPDDILNYRIRFTHVVDGKLPLTSQSMTLGQSITLQWTPPTTTQPYDEQPVPSRYGPYTDEIIITLPDSATQTSGGIATYVYTPNPLVVGEWQVQISASALVNGLEEYSQWSDAVPFFIVEPEAPPTPPRAITIQFTD
jgi:hypothetical protein